MSRERSEDILPSHLQYPGIWDLGASGPEGTKGYLKWILDDGGRTKAAAENLRFLRIGLHFLTVAQKFSGSGEVLDRVELHFFKEQYGAETGAGGHAHARNMQLWSFIDPDARQTVHEISLLPANTRRLSGLDLPVKEGSLAILNKVDTGDGLGTIYYPALLGTRLVLESTVKLPPGSYQQFSSLKIHEVMFEGPGTGVTVQRQGGIESPQLNTFESLQTYKGLTAEEAEEVIRQRHRLEMATQKVAASTVLVRNLDFTLDQMEERAVPVPEDRFVELAEGGIRSIERYMAA